MEVSVGVGVIVGVSVNVGVRVAVAVLVGRGVSEGIRLAVGSSSTWVTVAGFCVTPTEGVVVQPLTIPEKVTIIKNKRFFFRINVASPKTWITQNAF